MKKRLDLLLVQKGIATGRDNAKELIAKEIIYIDNNLITKPSTLLDSDVQIEVRGEIIPYVSRAGLKLEKALSEFNVSVEQKICMDIGSSTGGFTDCLLQNDAKLVYAVDVGRDQLVDKLRQDNRVVVMENTNIRYLEKSSLQHGIDFICIDVSFISLSLVLPKAAEILKDEGEIIYLIKPQFEAGPENVGKGGIVRDKQVHKKVLQDVLNLTKELGLSSKGITISPITGQKGNTEYLMYSKKSANNSNIDLSDINSLLFENNIS